jgi:hypothetical protein
MTSYQLQCGHWQDDDGPRREIGGVHSCTRCNTLRTVIIGFAGRAA